MKFQKSLISAVFFVCLLIQVPQSGLWADAIPAGGQNTANKAQSESEALFSQILALKSGNASKYVLIRDELVDLGSQATPFLRNQSASKEWKRSFLARIILDRMVNPKRYAELDEVVRKLSAELLKTVPKDFQQPPQSFLFSRLRNLKESPQGLDSPDAELYLVESTLWIQNYNSLIAAVALGFSKREADFEPLVSQAISSDIGALKQASLYAVSKYKNDMSDDVLIRILVEEPELNLRLESLDYLVERGKVILPKLSLASEKIKDRSFLSVVTQMKDDIQKN